jgi:hypothetical protein
VLAKYSDANHKHRGLAPDAKVAFIDLASGTTGGIFTPQDLSENYYPFSYSVGARVHSDSWGSGAAAQDYDFMASEVDLFTWENQVQRPPSKIRIALKLLSSCRHICAKPTAWLGLPLGAELSMHLYIALSAWPALWHIVSPHAAHQEGR